MSEKEDKSGKSRKRRVYQILLLLFAIGIGAFILFRYDKKSKLSLKIEALRAAGYPVTLEELNELYSIPDDVDNAADYILDAIDYYNEPIDTDLLSIVGNTELSALSKHLSEETLKLASEYLSDNRKSLELLHQAATLKYCRFPADLSTGQSPRLIGVTKIVRLLCFEAVVHAENSDSRSATECLISALNIAQFVSECPFIVCQIIQQSCQGNIVSTLEKIINRTDFADEQLDQLCQVITEKQNPSGLSYGFMGEFCNSIIAFENQQNNNTSVNQSPGLIYSLYDILGFGKRNAIIYFDFMKKYIEAGKLPLDKRMQAVKEIGNEVQDISKYRLFFNIAYPSYTKTFSEEINNIAKLRTAQVALAIERYRLKNNRVPESLDELVGDFIEEVPLDPFDGEELRYKQLNPGFVIYSIGQDLSDDNGKEQPKDSKERNNTNWDITFIMERRIQLISATESPKSR